MEKITRTKGDGCLFYPLEPSQRREGMAGGQCTVRTWFRLSRTRFVRQTQQSQAPRITATAWSGERQVGECLAPSSSCTERVPVGFNRTHDGSVNQADQR
jgi:hypothetical protein